MTLKNKTRRKKRSESKGGTGGLNGRKETEKKTGWSKGIEMLKQMRRMTDEEEVAEKTEV